MSQSELATPYLNTIPQDLEKPYPGDLEIEERLRNIIRWNAMAMVVRGNRLESGIGGHIATYASAATLWEVGFNHFFRGKGDADWGDMVYFQGHASPGIYARAFLEGRLQKFHLENFRHELRPRGGLSSYPHPWLMPDFWEFPTVSMGIGSLTAIYQARFNHYMTDRGLRDTSRRKVWAFLGDGELDEPESLGAITLAAREHLDNLIFVVNCNLQRLDGPVRGNGKIIQELETAFAGAGWRVIKVVWGSDFDPLIAQDSDGIFARVANELVDGQMQKFSVSSGEVVRRDFFGRDPALLKRVEQMSDEQIRTMRRGGHDPLKVYNAYRAAVEHRGSPVVILAHTVKGYGLGQAGEGKNFTHQQKKLNDDELRAFRDRFAIPIADDQLADVPFYQPPEDSPEIRYLREHRKALGGFIPKRIEAAHSLPKPPPDLFAEFMEGTDGREVTTTMVFVRILGKLLRDEQLGRYVVPIVPDEARTFGMEALFRQVGIYSHVGQLYEPEDSENLLYYREARDGAILEEGITEAGAMSSFIAAGTAHANHGVNMIPFFTFYSMFGFQRVGDFIWAAADSRAKGFLLGATSGRTTLNGEGLQHQDGNSHLAAYTVPNLLAYDPAFAFELAIIVQEGIRRMFDKGEDIFYYITLTNQFYGMPPKPEGIDDGVLRGLYRFAGARLENPDARVELLGSGAIMTEILEAQNLLEAFGVAADIWSVTSYKALYRDGCDTERWNMLHPGDAPRQAYVTECLGQAESKLFVAASDYVKALPLSIAQWIPGTLVALGTDGFGRSDSRAALRAFFEMDARTIAFAALQALHRQDKIPKKAVVKAMKQWEIDPDKANPAIS